jgi:hypothetical protein
MADRSASVLAGHRNVAAGLVDEDEPSRIYFADFFDEVRTLLERALPVPLRGDEGLFFRVYPMRSMARLIVDRLTTFPYLAQ